MEAIKNFLDRYPLIKLPLKRVVIGIMAIYESCRKPIKKKLRRINKKRRITSRRFISAIKDPIKLDIHAVEHCNLNCKGCSHFSPLAEPEYLDPEVFEKSMKALTKFQKHFFSIQILGGEPLLHPQLSEILDIARKYFQIPKVTIITNGLLLSHEDKLPTGFWESCRRNEVLIRITIYPVNIDYDLAMRRCDEEGVRYEIITNRRERNWSFFPLYPEGFRHVSMKLPFLKPLRCTSMNCFQLVGTKIFPCSHAAYIRHLNKTFGLDFKIEEKDYVDVNRLNSIRPLRKLFLCSTPFCKYCGTGYKKDTWDYTKKSIKEWIAP